MRAWECRLWQRVVPTGAVFEPLVAGPRKAPSGGASKRYLGRVVAPNSSSSNEQSKELYE